MTLTREVLVQRLKNHEDSYVERKPAGVEMRDIRKTLVAFANSVPEDREAVLFVGIRDDGEFQNVPNPDSLQKKIKKCCSQICYPPIQFTTELIEHEECQILAVIVSASSDRPHFSGPAYIRVGSESLVANAEQYEELITSRHTVARELLKWKDKNVSVLTYKSDLGRPEVWPVRAGTSQNRNLKDLCCRVIEVTPFYVRLLDTSRDAYFSEPLGNIEISYDDDNDRLLVIIHMNSV